MRKFYVFYTTAGTSPTRVIVSASTAADAIRRVHSWMGPQLYSTFKATASAI